MGERGPNPSAGYKPPKFKLGRPVFDPLAMALRYFCTG